MIKHVWFDVAGTLYCENPKFKAAHDELRYKTYASVAGVADMDQVKREYEKLAKQYGSNAAIFVSLGKPSDFWQRTFDKLDISDLIPPDPRVPATLEKIHKKVPISAFTNFKPAQIRKIFAHLQIPIGDFKYVLSGDDVPVRKPALDGFYKMIELSAVAPEQILFIGDREAVDIVPAKQVGITTCLLGSKGIPSAADYQVTEFAELGPLIAGLV
jgi:FMN phosphatase YigB (HAD superfamily)